MNTPLTITFANCLPSPTSLVTFTLTCSTAQKIFTVPTGARVIPDLGTAPVIWSMLTNISDPSVIPASYDLAPSTIGPVTTAVNVLPYIGVLDIQTDLLPPLGIAVSEKPATRSIFDIDVLHEEVQLVFAMHTQKLPLWCWCTVAASVAAYYNADTIWSPCKLATEKLPQPGECCVATPSAACNMPESFENALRKVGSLAHATLGRPSFKQLTEHIANGDAVGVNVQWLGTPLLHTVAITGFSADYDASHIATDRMIAVQDPYDGGVTVVAWDDFPAKYGDGASWFATYTTKNPERSLPCRP